MRAGGYMEPITYVLDRIEGDIALLIGQADSGILEVPAEDLPCGCREGSLLQHTDEGWKNDLAAELLRRQTMEEKLRNLLGKNK